MLKIAAKIATQKDSRAFRNTAKRYMKNSRARARGYLGMLGNCW